ncbi:MAG: IPT/TIG domain-containing protein [Treponema sp.]|nr:IPT/TIG domain-containing protein [Treponema sp.]
MEPGIGNPGDVLHIHGENFGHEKNEFSFITIAGAPPTASSYISWDDNLIRVKFPEFFNGGLVYVHRRDRRSNPVLFTRMAVIPQPVHGEHNEGGPVITSIEPLSGAVGSLITIHGNNFGHSIDVTTVEEAAGQEAPVMPGVWFSSAPADAPSPNMVPVFETDFGYDFWSEREIRVRIPDGAVSGNLIVRTPKDSSRPVFFEVTGKPGAKTFKDKRTYNFSYSAGIKAVEAQLPNSLYLWMPIPASSSSQRNISVIDRSMEPVFENFRGASLYQLTDMLPGAGKSVNLSFSADVYAVETNVSAVNIRQDMNSPVQKNYTLPSQLIPSDNPQLAAQAAAVTGREQNPYLKAGLIYNWLIKEIDFKAPVPADTEALKALEEKKADNYSAVLLFCAMARARGVPAIPVAGFLISPEISAALHYWAEFWVDGFGWVPLDPALGAGAAPQGFNLKQDHAAFYFGNMDNQRIAFSRGETTFSPMDMKGMALGRRRSFAFQNVWEEATGGLVSYSSLWSDITIMGMYIQ